MLSGSPGANVMVPVPVSRAVMTPTDAPFEVESIIMSPTCRLIEGSENDGVRGWVTSSAVQRIRSGPLLIIVYVGIVTVRPSVEILPKAGQGATGAVIAKEFQVSGGGVMSGFGVLSKGSA